MPRRRRRRQANPARSATIGLLLIGAAWFLRIGGFALIFYGSAIREWDGFILLVFPIFGAAYVLHRMGRRRRAVLAPALLASDSRPPIVYLRSFLDEDQDKGLTGAARGAGHTGLPLAYSTPAWGPREQDALAAVLGEIGPYVAIGKPKERLPELGAARMYVPDSQWQRKVEQLCSSARLIIVRAGISEGLRWEVEMLVSSCPPTRLLFLLPADPDQYQPFRRWADQVLPKTLPPDPPRSRMLMFDADWHPSTPPIERSMKRSLAPFLRQNGVELRETFLEALMEHNGLRW